jgi:DNA helicase-2/ATP-dependent DNA helicase PcrA
MADLDLVYLIDDRTAAFENHRAGVLVSLAGPGTGKTYSMLKRIDALVRRGVPVDAICYLTFIKEIGRAFISDYVEEFGQASYDANRPRISTLHSFACRVIRNQGHRIRYDGDLYFMSITDSGDGASDLFLSDLLPLVSSSGANTPARLCSAIEPLKQAWRDGADVATVPTMTQNVSDRTLALARAYRVVDWDQTVPTAHGLLLALSEPPGWITKLKHFLVDEYQDFNRAEQTLIGTLARSAESTVIVGDDDQSVYSRRGGSPDGLRRLVRGRDCDRVSLVRCRRCPSEIVDAANRFLSSMRPDPRVMQPYAQGGEILCLSFKSMKTELDYLKRYLGARVDELPVGPKPKDGCVCLFPSWKSLNWYFDRLSKGIPCSKRRSDGHALRAWLNRAAQLIARPKQRFLQRLLLEAYGSIKPRHKKKMVQQVLQYDVSPVEALRALAQTGELTGKAAADTAAFLEFCEALASEDPRRIAKAIAVRIQVADMVHATDALTTFLASSDHGEPQEEAIERLCDDLLPHSAEPAEDPRAVQFLTMHGSKGLTRGTVVMPGLEEAWLPGSATGGRLSEGRRLFYVALTRATARVLITSPRTRATGDPLNYGAPGRGQMSSFAADSGIRTKTMK